MPIPQGNERRRAPRVSVDEKLDANGQGDSFPVELLDLSQSGARFRSPRQIPVDTAIYLNINFYPVDFPIRALVVWNRTVADSDHFEHGAEFVNLPPEEAFLIKDYVRVALQGGEKPGR